MRVAAVRRAERAERIGVVTAACNLSLFTEGTLLRFIHMSAAACVCKTIGGINTMKCLNYECKSEWKVAVTKENAKYFCHVHWPLFARLEFCETCAKKCTCDSKSEKQVVCFNKDCGARWTVSLNDDERRSECPLHRHPLSCSVSRPALCESCVEQGGILVSDKSVFLGCSYRLEWIKEPTPSRSTAAAN